MLFRSHAVIGMCIDYKNYPMFFDCGNDAGLAVAGLNFPGYAEYAEDPVDGKTNIAAYEFPLWVAARHGDCRQICRRGAGRVAAPLDYRRQPA